MNRWKIRLTCLILLSQQMALPALCQQVATTQTGETGANSQAFPSQILRTGVSLNKQSISVNSMQLSDSIGLTPIIQRIQALRSQVNSGGEQTIQSLSVRQALWEETQKAVILLNKTDLDVDYALSEIGAELQIYNEILATFTADRDKTLARVNAASFISNGILWAICEAYSIPSYRNARLSIPSGTIGIAAGVVPSLASMYTLKAINGKKKTSEVDPNMLAKLFNYPTTDDIEYPQSVWQFINQVPADQKGTKTRLTQLVDRWIADSNMPAFTDRKSKKQLDVITGSVAQKKGLSIATLTARQVMLQQLSAEVMKMKRMLLELTMVLQGDKQLVANEPGAQGKLPRIGLEKQAAERRLLSEAQETTPPSNDSQPPVR